MVHRSCIVAFFFLIPIVLHGASYNDLQLELEPAIPRPLETVQASVTSFSYDVDSAFIEWTVNNVRIGTGKRISFQAPAANKTFDLVVTANNRSITRSITPSSVDIIWEANTYTPAFYMGRALPTQGSMITLVAMPHVGTITPDKLIFKWYRGSTLLVNESGIGKTVVKIAAPHRYDTYTVFVEVQTLDGTQVAYAGTKITSTKPELMLYGTSPLIGTLSYVSYATSAQNSDISTPTAIPFFFNITNPNELRYVYSTYNGVFTAKAEQPNMLSQSATVSQRFTGIVPASESRGSTGIQTPISPFGTPN